MNAIFLFNEKKENINRYLSRAARWYDVIQNGATYDEAECWLVEEMDADGRKEVMDYVFGVMYKTIIEVANYHIHHWNLYDIEDDYINEFSLEIYRNFYRYNNPKYGSISRDYSFMTFVASYAGSPARLVRRRQKGYAKCFDDNRRLIKRAKAIAAERLEGAYETMTAEDRKSVV